MNTLATTVSGHFIFTCPRTTCVDAVEPVIITVDRISKQNTTENRQNMITKIQSLGWEYGSVVE
jgi:hypothetical protein